eukprot:2508371-Amphidinium_carterae.1
MPLTTRKKTMKFLRGDVSNSSVLKQLVSTVCVDIKGSTSRDCAPHRSTSCRSFKVSNLLVQSMPRQVHLSNKRRAINR